MENPNQEIQKLESLPQKTLEVRGYWNPNENGKPEKRSYFDNNKNILIKFQSIGVLVPPVIEHRKTGVLMEEFYHITKNGYVIKATIIRRRGNEFLQRVDIIGSNGRIETLENHNPNEPNQAKLIYEPIVVIE